MGEYQFPRWSYFFWDTTFGGISADINLGVKHNLFKISYSYATTLDIFLQSDMLLSNCSISYGYIFNKGKILFNPNVAIGIAHYVTTGKLIDAGFFGPNYERIEAVKAIFKLSFYCHYRFTDRFAFGIFINPFIVGPISGIEGGWVFSFGKLWKDDH